MRVEPHDAHDGAVVRGRRAVARRARGAGRHVPCPPHRDGRGDRRAFPRRRRVHRPARRLLPLGHACRRGSTRRRCWPPPSSAGSPTCRAPPSTRTAGARTRCASRSACPPRTGSAKASRGWAPCSRRGAALPEHPRDEGRGPGRGRTPERDVSLRSGHRVMTSLSELGHDAWVLDPGRASARRSARGTAAGRVLPRAARQRGRGRNRAAVAGPARSALHGNRRVRMRGRLRQAAREGRAPPRRGRHAGWVAIEGWALRDLGGGAALGRAVGAGGAALRGQAVAERIGARRRVRGTRGRHRAGRDGGAVVQRSGRDRIEDRRNRDRVRASSARRWRRSRSSRSRPKAGVYDYAARYTAGATEYFAPARLERRGRGRGREKRRARRTGCVCGT